MVIDSYFARFQILFLHSDLKLDEKKAKIKVKKLTEETVETLEIGNLFQIHALPFLKFNFTPTII